MLFLIDKDGTAIAPIKGKFTNSPENQQRLPGCHFRPGDRVIFLSNQAGVEAKHKTLESAICEMSVALSLVPEVEFGLIAPDFSGSYCYAIQRWGNQRYERGSGASFRKPGTGMLDLALRLTGESQAVYVGDRLEDFNLAIAANVKFCHADYWRSGGYPGDFGDEKLKN